MARRNEERGDRRNREEERDSDIVEKLVHIHRLAATVKGGRNRLAFAAAIPGARLETIERAGHYPHIEQPQEFARRALAFASATPAKLQTA